MISQLTGIVVSTHKNPLTIDVHDVGYSVFVPEKMLGILKHGQKITAFIHTHVREDAIALFGFASLKEREIFDLLLTVSGIGPKTALNVMDHGADAIQNAIRQSDTDFFTAIPRLGRKNAQKIIIELRNKILINNADFSHEIPPESVEIMEALVSMGFDRKEIREVIKKLSVSET